MFIAKITPNQQSLERAKTKWMFYVISTLRIKFGVLPLYICRHVSIMQNVKKGIAEPLA